jgi:hypothetical protein
MALLLLQGDQESQTDSTARSAGRQRPAWLCPCSSAYSLRCMRPSTPAPGRQGGNNNTYCHDSPLNWFDWDAAADGGNSFTRFFRALLQFRRARIGFNPTLPYDLGSGCPAVGGAPRPYAKPLAAPSAPARARLRSPQQPRGAREPAARARRRRRHPELRRGAYGGLDFHGAAPGAPDLSEASRLVAWSTGDGAGGGVYVAFNASHKAQVVELPHWPGRAWRLVADTGKARRPGRWERRPGMRGRAAGVGRACGCGDGAGLRSDPRARACALRAGRRLRCALLAGGAHRPHGSRHSGRARRGHAVACLHHGCRARRVLQTRPRPKQTRPQADLPYP